MPIPRRSRLPLSWTLLGLLSIPALARATLPFPALGTELILGARVVIVGERHRRPSGHAFFLRFVRDLAARGEKVLVGLEIPADRQDDLDAVLAGCPVPRGLAHPIIDSPSYRVLLSALGEMARSRNVQVKVRALDAPDSDSRDRDEAMAEEVFGAVKRGRFDRIAILAGNLHALKEIPWSPEIPSAGTRLAGLLAEGGVPVVSLIQVFEGDCPGRTEAALYPASDPLAASGVLSLWNRLNTYPASAELARRAADGVVVWGCSE